MSVVEPARTASIFAPDTRDPGGVNPLEAFVDEEVGIVTALAPALMPEGAPADFHCTVASVADTRTLGAWLADRIAAGTSFGDPLRARTAAIGEALERYCGNRLPHASRRLSGRELIARGRDRIRPDELPTWTPAQLRRPGFPFVAYDDDTPVEWVRGIDAAGRERWAPLSWVYLNTRHGSRRDHPRINVLNYSGIAAGNSPNDAARRALAEIVERDALVTWWCSGADAIGIDPESIAGFRARWEGGPLEVSLVLVPGDLPCPVVGAYVFDPRTQVAASGFACAPSASQAASKAAQEALQVWIASSGLLDPRGPSWQALDEGLFARGVYLPHRPDRRYLDDAGEDFSRIRDLAAQTQLWLDPRMLPLARRFVDPPRTISAQEVAPGSVDAVLAELERRGRSPVAFDLTTPDVRETGAAVVRVLAPGLHLNAPAAYAYLGSTRLAKRCRALGRDGADPVLAPPPHN